MGTSINWLARLSQKDQERILGHIERLVKLERKLSKEILEDEEMAMEYVENDGEINTILVLVQSTSFFFNRLPKTS